MLTVIREATNSDISIASSPRVSSEGYEFQAETERDIRKSDIGYLFILFKDPTSGLYVK